MGLESVVHSACQLYSTERRIKQMSMRCDNKKGGETELSYLLPLL